MSANAANTSPFLVKPLSAAPFVRAMETWEFGGEAAAIALVRAGKSPHLMTMVSTITGEIESITSPLQASVSLRSAALLGALAESGADLDLYVPFPSKSESNSRQVSFATEITAVGTAIMQRRPAMLEALRAAGADFRHAKRKKFGSVFGRPSPLDNCLQMDALQMALLGAYMDIEVVTYLLDVAHMDARMCARLATHSALVSLRLRAV